MDVAATLYPEATADTTDEVSTPAVTEVLEVSDDGALAAGGATEDTIDDGSTPKEEGDDTGYEKRYKDLQAEFTQRTQELSQLKSEVGDREAEITRRTYELQDKFGEQEQVAGFLLSQYQGEFQQLQQVNVQQLNQQQYAQWQQAIQQASQRVQRTNQALEGIQARGRQIREDNIRRQAAVARASLVRTIDKFDEVYPEIHKHAVAQGVSADVFREITDPGLIRIIHEHRQMKSQPDVIKKVTQSAPARPSAVAKARVPAAQPKTLAQKLYPSLPG